VTLAVPHVGGQVTTATSVTSDSWTSTAGSALGIIGHVFGAHTLAAGDVTDSKGNTYTFAGGINGTGSTPGIGFWYNLSGTRGASHTVTFNPGVSANVAVVEVTGNSLSFVAATFATASDGTSSFDVTAAAAISGTQIGMYGATIDTGDSKAWTQPSGYTNIINQGNGISFLVSDAAYKLNETGTPTVGATGTFSPVAAGREVFATFQEGAASPDDRIVTSIRRPGQGGPRSRPQAVRDYGTAGNAVTLTGQSDGTSTADATMVVATALVAQSDGSSTVTGALSVIKALTGQSDGSSTATATERTAVALAGQSDGSSTATATLTTGAQVDLTAQSDGTSTATADLAVATALVASSDGTSTTTGALAVVKALTATSDGSSTATAAMVATKALVGTSDGGSTATAGLRVAAALAASSSGSSTAIASLTVTSGPPPTAPFGTLLGSAEFYGVGGSGKSWNDKSYEYWTNFVP
jgi:hypothetical protein